MRNSSAVSSIVDRLAGDCLAVRVRMLNRVITGIYDDALRPLGLTTAQLNVLVAVAKMGPVSPGAVARLLSLEKSTLSRNVERMKAKGWVTASPGDSRREQRLEIGRSGRELLERVVPLWEEAQERARELLGERGARSVFRLGDMVWGPAG